MAERTCVGTFVVGSPDIDSAAECPECGFDSLLTFPIHVISESGVSPFGTYEGCARCFDEGEGG